ncbi:MAG: toxin-antitoxin system HicB family antitoxin [Gammaproteobacteria bacterium]|nr:MAG: toxin-antitoxin system HicB family antitoxin [Gammaproteobacteria bacterium]
MNNFLTYKNYSAKIEFSEEDDCFIGHLYGIDDIVGFHASSVAKLKEAFYEAVDDYLQTCNKADKTPQKSFSGDLTISLTPDVHANIASIASSHNQSINQWASNVLQKEAVA